MSRLVDSPRTAATQCTGSSHQPFELERVRSALYLFALRALGDRAVAEDVAQESLVRALGALAASSHAPVNNLGAFVRGIARHVIADVQRARLCHPHDPLPAESGSRPLRARSRDPLGALLLGEETEKVRQALGELPPKDRSILRLSFFEGLRPAEIAARLCEPAERIRKRKSRALARLRAAFFDGEGQRSDVAETEASHSQLN